MKKLIIALVFCLMAVPAMADSWTFIFEATGNPTGIRIQHRPIPDPMPEAQAFIESVVTLLKFLWADLSADV